MRKRTLWSAHAASHSLASAGNPFLGAGTLDSERSFDVGAFAANYGGVTVSKLSSGTLVYSQGEPADAMYYLQDGQIQITVVRAKARKAFLAFSVPAAFSAKAACSATARGSRPSLHCRQSWWRVSIAHASFAPSGRIRKSPSSFSPSPSAAVVDLREGLISHLFDSTEKRLARALLLLANQAAKARRGTSSEISTRKPWRR